MNNEEITAALLNGSRNLDRMKSEIDQTVRMLIGFAKKCSPGLSKAVRFSQEYDMFKWEVFGEVGHGMNPSLNHLDVCCLLKFKGGWTMGWDTKNPHLDPTSHKVKAVYEALPKLVEVLISEFPEIQERWAHLIEASEVVFRT